MEHRRFVARAVMMVAFAPAVGCLGRRANDGANGSNNSNGAKKSTRFSNTTMPHTNDSNCPTFGEPADERVCSRGEPRPNAPVVLRPEAPAWKPHKGGVPTFTFTFTLTNRSESDFDIDTDAWTVRRKQGNSWSVVKSNDWTGKATAVGPTDEHAWSLSRDQHPTPHDPDITFIVAPVESGTYALTVSGRFSTADESTVECTAVFESK